MTQDYASVLEQLDAFAQLHAREMQHPDELGLSPEQQKLFVSLCSVNVHEENLALRIARSLRMESEEALRLLAEAGRPMSILDCGCGWGTHALLFAFLGARVIGAELIEERLHIGRVRLEWYRKQANRPLDVEFMARNIFPVLRERSCEMVWICQAISHIHPAEDFLDQLYETMPPGGWVVISDANWLHPLTRWHLYKQYWRVHKKLRWYSHSRYKDPATGEPVEMAEERVFSPGGLARLVRRSGFEVTCTHTRGFVPVFRLSRQGNWPGALRLSDRLDAALSHTPIIGRLGGFLVVVGRKGAERP